VAFLPSNIPPGIDFSEDPLLQGRLFSYQDTQLSRLGTVNFHQIPINQAKGCPFQNFQRDGQMQTQVFKGRANYEPNSLEDAGENGGPREDPKGGFRSHPDTADGAKQRIRAETFADHYSQPRQYWRSLTAPEQAHTASAFVFELSKVSLGHVRNRVLSNLRNLDEELANRVADGLNLPLPEASQPAAEPQDLPEAPSIRIIGKYKDSLKGRKVGILVHDGSDGDIIDAVKSAAEAAGASVMIVAPKIGGATLANGKILAVDGQLAGTPSVMFDAVAIVLSEEGTADLLGEGAAVDFAKDAFGHLKAIGYTPQAQPLLDKAGVTPDEGVFDLSGRAKTAFTKAASTRQWDREPSVRNLA
jgi:catalase